ncbi:unnamed protein product [Clonostachys rhizophaga]|uniref:AMP-dependent synthetase/ligase domain-containing protein n=1 Tax=Clonostachys rhizophaga TaxID=160324 RepID=A0A9N9V4E5_9HYPO|nr:unnamed protein product [Clonostachys rhizophaga]
MLSPKDLQLIRSFENGESTSCPFSTVTSAFYHHAFSQPAAIALRDMSSPQPKELTYYDLARQAQNLALKLRRLGVGPGQRVPLLVKRGIDMIIGIWAVLSCGAQYVPLDGGVVPDSTIRVVTEQSGGIVILCVNSTEHRLRELRRQQPLVPILIDELCQHRDNYEPQEKLLDLATDDLGCYVIYTSGTTGKPKGVDVTHRNVANLVCQAPGNLSIRPGIIVGSTLNISFDMAAWEIFACLCNGGTLVMRGPQWEPTLRQINVLICTPTILSRYHPEAYPQIKVVATAGEPSSQQLADLWAAHTTYWNCCGPTETTIVNTMSKHVVGEPLSIGKPTPNNTVYILDSQLRRVDIGSAGSMWAGGDGVSRGYVGLESKTRENYITDVYSKDGSKMYKTGDLGYWRPDGNIEILGRADDQVKVKGFRVELDGISATLASFPGVIRATVLIIDGEIHGFVSPAHHNIPDVLSHTKKSQPYYAVPQKIHALAQLPLTANGKIDKRALRVIATTQVTNLQPVPPPAVREKINVDLEAAMETRSLASFTTCTSSATCYTQDEKCDLSRELPNKKQGRLIQGLRHKIFIIYRTLLSIVWFLNVGVLIALVVAQSDSEWLGIMAAANLVTCVMIRQDLVINLLYTLTCSIPKNAPLWIRSRCAEIYHLGGIHSGAGICATVWLFVSTVQYTLDHLTEGGSLREMNPNSLAVLVLSWMLCFLCLILVAFAWPAFRKLYHNQFERIHRFVGWLTLVLFWIRTVLYIYGRRANDIGLAFVQNPIFWMLIVVTLCVASSWLYLRRVPVESEVLSDHAIRLHFSYTTPTNGTFTRISQRPLLEWHSFATIPKPKPSGKGYSLIVSNAGDWTRNCIKNPPTELWVRGMPTCGVMRITTLFNRVVLIATGSGIGPVLGHINNPTCASQLIWSTPHPEAKFGKEIIGNIRRSIPDAVIHDTRKQGRPDLVRMGYNMARGFGAEAVIIIANEKITKKVVYGLQTRGIPAYGAIWDS